MAEEVEKFELSKEWQYIKEDELATLLNAPFAWVASELKRAIEEASPAIPPEEPKSAAWIRVKRVIDIISFLDKNSIVRFPK